MGRNSRRRRAAKQRRDAARRKQRTDRRRQPNEERAHHHGDDPFCGWSTGAPQRDGARSERSAEPDTATLIDAALHSWGVDDASHRQLVEMLIARGAPAAAEIDRRWTDVLAGLWEHGWTPRDLVHVVARRRPPAHADLLARVVVDDGRRMADRDVQVDPRWRTQLSLLADRAPRGPADDRRDAQWIGVAIAVLSILIRLPDVPSVMPAPGTAEAGIGHVGRLDERMLTRVRALLAKAESTGFEQEAEALTAKAQELITRHVIAEAALHSVDDVGRPSVRRILLTDPYADAKATLVSRVAGANRCQAVQVTDLGWTTVIGYDADLDAVEVLVASLLTQATTAMAQHGSRRDVTGRSTTRSFRRSFLLGFGHRVGERLHAAVDEGLAAAAERDRALPVLASRDEQVLQTVQELFPQTVQRSRSVSNGTGWAAGRAAADMADLDASAGALR